MWQKLHDGTVAWLKKPYDDSMDATHWFLFMGLLLAISWLWSRVIHRI